MSDIADLFAGGGAPDASLPFVQGKVTDNGEKKQAGMVKVEFVAWKRGGNICEWMPVLHSYAGGGFGCYCMPEVGDLVLVGFLGADYRQPFVAGSFYPANAKMASSSFTPKNEKKRFRTKGGIDVTLSDEEGKQSVRAVTPKGLTLSAGDEKEIITLGDKEGKNKLSFDCKKGAIALEGNSKITIKTGKCQITLDGKKGAVEIKCDQLTVKATRQLKLGANQTTTVEGGRLKLSGKQTAELSGATMTQVKGAMVKIN